MILGTCRLKITIYESDSLKYKRHILKSIIERLKNKFNISIAEIALNDTWQSAVIGFACVTNDRAYANKIINKVISFIDMDNRVEIIDCIIEIL